MAPVMEQGTDFCNLWLTEGEERVTNNGQDKTGIQNYLGLFKTVYEIKRMTLTRSKSGTCEYEKTGGKSKPRKQKQGRYGHGERGGHRLNREKKQDEKEKTCGLGISGMCLSQEAITLHFSAPVRL